MTIGIYGGAGDQDEDGRAAAPLYELLDNVIAPPLFSNDRNGLVYARACAIALNGLSFDTPRMIAQYWLKA